VAYPPRIQFAGGIYHVTARGNNQQHIFRSTDDYEDFLTILDRVCRRHRWVLLAYCLLGNHFHLVVLTPEPNLAAGMQQLMSAFARTFNFRYSRRGHVFERRYWSEHKETEAGVFNALAYTGDNPCAAGLVARAREWECNSYATFFGDAIAPECLAKSRLLAYFHRDRRRALLAYQRLVEGRREQRELQARLAA
jgi:putative transposase